MFGLSARALGRAIAAVAAGVGLIVGAFIAFRSGSERSTNPLSGRQSPPASAVFGEPRERDAGPLLLGKKVTIAEASLQAGFPLYRPAHAQANDLNVRNAYIEPTQDDNGTPWAQAAIDYDSGILLIVLPAWVDGLDVDPESQYAAAAEGYPHGPYARVTTIHGVPALVIERNAKGDAYVDLVLNGVRFQLYGQYAPIEESVLVEVAESILIPIPTPR